MKPKKKSRRCRGLGLDSGLDLAISRFIYSLVPKSVCNMLKLKILDVCRCEEREEEEEFLTVIVSDPHKVGEGMSSYMAYKVSTR
jgi:hypothetical protein